MIRQPYAQCSAAEQRQRDVEAARHGGVVALEGGPWSGSCYWRDWYERIEPAGSSRRVGYADTGVMRPSMYYAGEDVFRFDPAAVPAPAVAEPARADAAPEVCCGRCERRVLLLVPGREVCERCRIELGLPRNSAASAGSGSSAPDSAPNFAGDTGYWQSGQAVPAQRRVMTSATRPSVPGPPGDLFSAAPDESAAAGGAD